MLPDRCTPFLLECFQRFAATANEVAAFFIREIPDGRSQNVVVSSALNDAVRREHPPRHVLDNLLVVIELALVMREDCAAISRMEACPPRSKSVSSITGW
jgi:hypothetical protein